MRAASASVYHSLEEAHYTQITTYQVNVYVYKHTLDMVIHITETEEYHHNAVNRITQKEPNSMTERNVTPLTEL